MEFILGLMIGIIIGLILAVSSEDLVTIDNKKGKEFFVNYKDELYKLLKMENNETDKKS